MTSKSPILDSEQSDAFVIGWATTERGAMRVARRWSRDHQISQTPASVYRCTVSLNYDPDVMDPLETERANGKRGYVIRWAGERQ